MLWSNFELLYAIVGLLDSLQMVKFGSSTFCVQILEIFYLMNEINIANSSLVI